MTEENYEPVSCDYHDQLEAAATMKTEVEIEFIMQGEQQRERGRIADVYTSEGAEYVKFAAGNGTVEIRLDQIVGFKEI